ncbi:hypothetical protein DL95DRAFT_389119, partial [Leptodontidium sp. 2 PMI_412]
MLVPTWVIITGFPNKMATTIGTWSLVALKFDRFKCSHCQFNFHHSPCYNSSRGPFLTNIRPSGVGHLRM